MRPGKVQRRKCDAEIGQERGQDNDLENNVQIKMDK